MRCHRDATGVDSGKNSLSLYSALLSGYDPKRIVFKGKMMVVVLGLLVPDRFIDLLSCYGPDNSVLG